MLTAKQVAERFGVNPQTVRFWARTGKLPSVRTPGGGLRFRAEVVEAFERPDDVTADQAAVAAGPSPAARP